MNATGESSPLMVEIGAGTGALTHWLLGAGMLVTAIEIDPALVAILRSREDLAEATIVEGDALTLDYESLSRRRRWHACGNLPYYVATPLVTRLVEMDRGPQTITVMVQRDVADRFVAAPGTSAYGSLTVAVRYAMETTRAFSLGPRAFYPAPKVSSTVVQLVRRREPAVRPRDVARFRQVVRAAFAYRRKTLANSLALALDIDRRDVERALRNAGIPTEQRGERLDLPDFARLADALA